MREARGAWRLGPAGDAGLTRAREPKQGRLFQLERPAGAISWELRAKWATREEVVLSLSERCDPRRLEGTVDRVAPSGAFVIVGGWHVPIEDVLAVHRPHFTQHEAA